MTSPKYKIFIFNNNDHCELRGLDTSRLIRYFKLNTCQIIENPHAADYIVLFTCSFTMKAGMMSLNLIKHFNRYKGELIVAGCLPAILPKKLNQIFKGKSILTKNLYEIDKIFPDFLIKFSDITEDAHKGRFSRFSVYDKCSITIRDIFTSLYFFSKERRFIKFPYHKIPEIIRDTLHYKLLRMKVAKDRKKRGEKDYPILRVSRGCINNCSYCSIRYATGKLKSKPLDACLSEYKKLLDEGHRHFKLAADDLGNYGYDINSSLGELFDKMTELDKNLNVTWCLISLRPVWIVKYQSTLLKMIKEGKITTLECPVQSGSERILKLMHRYSNIKKTVAALEAFKKTNPNLWLVTHIMVGFPSETEEDFLASLELIKKGIFNSIIPVCYSRMEITPSSKMKDQVDFKTIKRRWNSTCKLLKEMGCVWVRPI